MQEGELSGLLEWVGNNDMAGQERDEIGTLLGEAQWWDDTVALHALAGHLFTEAGSGLVSQLENLDDYDQVRRSWLTNLADFLREQAERDEAAAAELTQQAQQPAQQGQLAEYDEQWGMYRRYNDATQAWEFAASANAGPDEWLTAEQAAAERSAQ
jgi:hypothetical protein